MNQQDKDKQQLRPSPYFKVGEIVEYAGLIGKVVSTNYHNTHPILVDFNSGEWEAFTKEGCLYGEDVELFRLEESDKPQQASNNEQDSRLFTLLKTTLHSEERTLAEIDKALDEPGVISRGIEMEYENFYNETKACIRLLRHLISEYQRLEEDTIHVSVGI